MELDKHSCKQDLSFIPTWLTRPSSEAKHSAMEGAVQLPKLD